MAEGRFPARLPPAEDFRSRLPPRDREAAVGIGIAAAFRGTGAHVNSRATRWSEGCLGETGVEQITIHPSKPSDTDLRETKSQAGLGRRLQLAFSFLTMLTFLLVTLQFVMTRGSIADPDIWWHLRNAEYLFQNHQLPRQDLFSFTVPGVPWINHEWLAEVPYYLAWRAWGLAGINVVTLLVIELIFLGLLYLCYQESGHFKASIAACCFCTFLAKVSYGPRTILFGYLYLVILLIILQRFRRKGTCAPVADSAAVLFVDQYARLLVTGPDIVRHHCRRRPGEKRMGDRRGRTLVAHPDPQAGGHGRGEHRRALRKSVRGAPGVLPLRSCLPAEAEHFARGGMGVGGLPRSARQTGVGLAGQLYF